MCAPMRQSRPNSWPESPDDGPEPNSWLADSEKPLRRRVPSLAGCAGAGAGAVADGAGDGSVTAATTGPLSANAIDEEKPRQIRIIDELRIVVASRRELFSKLDATEFAAQPR